MPGLVLALPVGGSDHAGFSLENGTRRFDMQHVTKLHAAMPLVVVAGCLSACVGPSIGGGAAHATASRAAPVTAAPAVTPQEAAQPTTADSTEQSAQERTAREDEMICRREAVIGTHRRERRCYTRAQLDEMRRQAGEFLEEEGRPLVFPGAE